MTVILRDLKTDMVTRGETPPTSPWAVLPRFLLSTVVSLAVLVAAAYYLRTPLPGQEPLWGRFLWLLIAVACAGLAGDLAAGITLLKRLRQARWILLSKQAGSFLLSVLVLVFTARHLETLLLSLVLYLHPVPADAPPGTSITFPTGAFEQAVVLGYWMLAITALIGLIDLAFSLYGIFRPRREDAEKTVQYPKSPGGP